VNDNWSKKFWGSRTSHGYHSWWIAGGCRGGRVRHPVPRRRSLVLLLSQFSYFGMSYFVCPY
jgi:hypothetical protein